MKFLVRRQENSSFADFGRVLACAVCKCAVLCVGCLLFRFVFLSLCGKMSESLRFLLHLAVTFLWFGLRGVTYCTAIRR